MRTNTPVIVPALIPRSFHDIEETIERVHLFSNELQVDVVDGIYVENVSWPYGEGENAGDPSAVTPLAKEYSLELDLMISRPIEELPKWLAAGAKRVVVHMESCTREALIEARRIAHEHNALLGIASQNDTSIEAYLEALTHADYAQCMGIGKIGVQGQPFDERVLPRIARVRAEFSEMEIAVDGSVNLATVHKLSHAGATRLIAGSAILHADDLHAAYDALYAQAMN